MGLLQRKGSKCGKTQLLQSHWDLCFFNCKLEAEGCPIDHRGEILHSAPLRLYVPSPKRARKPVISAQGRLKQASEWTDHNGPDSEASEITLFYAFWSE